MLFKEPHALKFLWENGEIFTFRTTLYKYIKDGQPYYTKLKCSLKSRELAHLVVTLRREVIITLPWKKRVFSDDEVSLSGFPNERAWIQAILKLNRQRVTKSRGNVQIIRGYLYYVRIMRKMVSEIPRECFKK